MRFFPYPPNPLANGDFRSRRGGGLCCAKIAGGGNEIMSENVRLF